MKVYVSNVNLPVPRSIGRYLAHSVVGCRKSGGDSDEVETGEDGVEKQPQTYEVWGSLSPQTSGDEPEEAAAAKRVATPAEVLAAPVLSGVDATATDAAVAVTAEAKPEEAAVAVAPVEVAAAGEVRPASAAPPSEGAAAGVVPDATPAAAVDSTPVPAPTVESAAPAPVAAPKKTPRVLASSRGLLPLADKKPAHRRATPAWVETVVAKDDREALKAALMAADVIVYDITNDHEEADFAVEFLTEKAEYFKEQNIVKTFVAVSSVLSWAKSKYDSDDTESTLTEDDFRRRKPHPNYKNQTDTEKNVIKLGKDSNVKAYVIAAGIVYHPDECLVHGFLKDAWQGAPFLTCYGDGSNVLPMIHLTDLSNIVVDVVDASPEKRYILAVDESKTTMYQVLKTISETVGTGKVFKVTKEQALQNKKISQADFDMMQINLRLDSAAVKEMSFDWKFEAGLVDSIKPFVQEFKEYRKLTPIRVIMTGAPYSGKTYYAKKLAEHYEIHYLNVEEIVKKAFTTIEKRITESQEENDEEDLAALKDKYQELKDTLINNNGRFAEDQINQFIRDELRSMPCRNQGYVLDGFPTTIEEASALFMPTGEEEELADGTQPTVDPLTFPEFIFRLELSDEVIKERVMALSESETAGTRNAEEALVQRIDDFHKANATENTVLNYFDEKEVHPLLVSTELNTPEQVFAILTKKIGKPHNYGPSEEQMAETKRKEVLEKLRQLEISEMERTAREKEENERQSKAVVEWNKRLHEVQKQEAEMLEAKSAPLRGYLVKHVMPTLTAALIDVCKTRPDDPIDYLAEYLFKNNEKNAAI